MAKITIIDDDMEYAENLSAILRTDGHKTSILDTAENAVSALVKDRPDLVILDVMFPDNPAAGFDLARQVRRRWEIRDLPIILLTAVNQEFPIDFSAKDIDPEWMPVQDFIEKPVKKEKLLRKVNALLRERR